MTVEIFGTEADVGGSGKGQLASETNFRDLLGSFAGLSGLQNFVRTGLAVSAGAGLSVTVATGRAFISGYLARVSAAESVTVPASATRYLWLELVKSAGLVTGSQFTLTTSATPPSDDACFLAQVVTNTTIVTGVDDRRKFGGEPVIDSYVGDGAGVRSIVLGFRPSFVIIQGDHSNAVSKIISFSQITANKINSSATQIGFFAENYTGTPTIGFSTSNEKRPLITSTGFDIDGNGAGALINGNGFTYYYVAWL